MREFVRDAKPRIEKDTDTALLYIARCCILHSRRRRAQRLKHRAAMHTAAMHTAAMHTAARRGREEHRGGRPVSEAKLSSLQEGALASLGAEDLRRGVGLGLG